MDGTRQTDIQLTDTDASSLDLNFTISNGIISSKNYHKRDKMDDFGSLDVDGPLTGYIFCSLFVLLEPCIQLE